MNIILQLQDPEFVHKFFTERLLPRYPAFKTVKEIKINPIKNKVWERSYHVVIEFQTTLAKKNGQTLTLPIYCSAHSSEPRKNVYDGMKFLWDHGFYRGNLTIPRPLFYSHRFKATFYRGIKGENLYHYIRENNFAEIEIVVPKAAGLFAKLHNLPTKGARNFNRKNSRIETVIPGVSHIIFRIKEKYPSYHFAFKEIYARLIEKEERYLASGAKLCLVHGDAHPENVIKVSERKAGLIDFTDLCLSDPARDVGTFLQQLEFMASRKIPDAAYVKKITDLFLTSYQKSAKLKIDEAWHARIDTYYYWTAMRTATMFLLQDQPEPERAKILIDETAKNFKISI